jgi:cobalt/nickel transport system permease protein
VVLTAVLIVQCYLFSDGGVMALGANVFNMALLGVMGGYAVYRVLGRWLPGVRGQVAAVAFAGWCSTVMAAVSCAGQLAWSGRVAWSAGFTAMTSVHMLIGLGEGLISALVWLAIQRARPEVVLDNAASADSRWIRGLVLYGLLITLGIGIFVAPFACPWPDGLEAVAAKLGFEQASGPPLVPAPAPDYRIVGIRWAVGATALAGAGGSLVAFALALLLGRWLVPKPAADAAGGRGVEEGRLKKQIKP